MELLECGIDVESRVVEYGCAEDWDAFVRILQQYISAPWRTGRKGLGRGEEVYEMIDMYFWGKIK